MAHFTVSDIEGGRFYSFERFSRAAAGLAGASSSPLRVWLDDWSAEWRDVDGMHANLNDVESGSRGWFYDKEPLSDPTGTHHLEVVGEGRTIRFLLDGREMFQAERHFEEPYRVFRLKSVCGLSV